MNESGCAGTWRMRQDETTPLAGPLFSFLHQTMEAVPWYLGIVVITILGRSSGQGCRPRRVLPKDAIGDAAPLQGTPPEPLTIH